MNEWRDMLLPIVVGLPAGVALLLAGVGLLLAFLGAPALPASVWRVVGLAAGLANFGFAAVGLGLGFDVESFGFQNVQAFGRSGALGGQLVLGVDRDNERLAALFDERDPAVLEAMRRVVSRCIDRGVTVSICGQAPSVYPELTRKLVEWGVTSVSVTPDMIEETRRTLLEAEASAARKDRSLAGDP